MSFRGNFWGCMHCMWKFPSQGLNLHCSCNLRHSCNKARSLTRSATGKPLVLLQCERVLIHQAILFNSRFWLSSSRGPGNLHFLQAPGWGWSHRSEDHGQKAVDDAKSQPAASEINSVGNWKSVKLFEQGWGGIWGCLRRINQGSKAYPGTLEAQGDPL